MTHSQDPIYRKIITFRLEQVKAFGQEEFEIDLGRMPALYSNMHEKVMFVNKTEDQNRRLR